MAKILIFTACILLTFIIGKTAALGPLFPWHQIPHPWPPRPPIWHPKPHHFACKNQIFHPATHVCCNDQLSPRNGFQNPGCCGDVAFDRTAKLCCAGKLINRAANANACCGITALDISQHDCCNGAAIARTTQICCAGVNKPRTSIYDVCCASEIMDKTQALCCGGAVKKIGGTFVGGSNIVPYTYACCGTHIYKTSQSHCVNGIIHPKSFRNWPWPWWRFP